MPTGHSGFDSGKFMFHSAPGAGLVSRIWRISRVASVAAVRRACSDARAVGCYSRSRAGSVITIPARPAARVRATLLHEYGHHVDAALATPAWWTAPCGTRWRLLRNAPAN